ncbi:MAG: hypothetical protein Q8M22_10415, partial [Actinomycetota bacterium]|nr:hypothetical protein [Actinomycetota bacterium]
MRTQPSGSSETLEVIELIDVIDTEPGVFGPSGPRERDTPRPPRRPPPWPYLAVAAAVVVAAVLVLLRPWDTPPAWRTFPVTHDPPTQPGPWVLSEPPAPLMSVLAADDPAVASPSQTDLGHLFAADGATYDRGRWAMFRVHAVADDDVGNDGMTAVDPRAADIDDAGGQRRQLTWQPEPTQRITVTAHGFTDADLRTFAAVVGVHDGHAALRTGYALGSLRPRSSVTGFVAAQQVLDSFGQAPPPPTVSIVRYRAVNTPTAVATNPAPSDAAEAVRFLLGGTDTTVGDRAAVSSRSSTMGTVIAWVDGGLLKVTTGSLSPTLIAQRAATVRPLAESDVPATVDAADAVSVGRGRTDGHTWEATAHFGRVTAICVILDGDESTSNCAFDAHATLPQFNYVTTDLGIVVVVLSNRADPGAVRFTSLEGETSVRRLRPLVWDISALAFLPEGSRSYTLVGSEQAADTDGLQPVVPEGDRFLLDDPLLSPYSADITTPLPSQAVFNLWTLSADYSWLTVQAARRNPPPATFDSQRRVVNGVDVVSSLDDPAAATVAVALDDGWWLTVRSHGIDDEELTTLARNLRVVDGEVRAVGETPAILARPALAAGDWSEHLLVGRVHSESRYLTTADELVTLRVGDASSAAVQAVVAPYLLDDVSVVDGVISGTWPDTGERMVSWTEGDQVLTLSGQVPVAHLLALRPSVRPATADEWAAMLDGLRPDYRLGAFTEIDSGTTDGGDLWAAGVQRAERRGQPQYLWWWTVPGGGGRSASIEVREPFDRERPMFDILVVDGATYVF